MPSTTDTHYYNIEFIEHETGQLTMVSAVKASIHNNRKPRRAAARRHLTVAEIHSNIIPNHSSFHPNIMT
jgi:hypothetical protein